jgi:hypothetical protein
MKALMKYAQVNFKNQTISEKISDEWFDPRPYQQLPPHKKNKRLLYNAVVGGLVGAAVAGGLTYRDEMKKIKRRKSP